MAQRPEATLSHGLVRRAIDLRRCPWVRPIVADYADRFATLSSLFAGNPADTDAWRATIARVQAAPRDRALVAAAAWGVAEALNELLGTHDIQGLGVNVRIGDGPVFPVVNVAIITALAFGLSPYLVRPLRRIFALVILLVCAAAMYLGAGFPADVLGGIFVGFAVAALQFRNDAGLTPASTQLSFVRDYAAVGLGTIGFVIFAYVIITATSNAVNLTDGLDGLAAGSSIMVFASYVVIGFWQFRNSCVLQPELAQCYTARDPLDIALVAAAAMGACFGFLWWNASPAKIFMGDTGSLALGGALAGLAVLTRTELLVVILGGLFVTITLSVIIQVASFKTTGKRVFRMAPLQPHFGLRGWQEVTIVIRFWIIAGLFVALGLGLFYAEWVVGAG